MNTHLENAPLLELIAELRWDIASNEGVFAGPGMPAFLPPSSIGQLEEFFAKFGSAIPNEYGQTEKLVPPNFPLIIQQPIYRYKNGKGSDHNSLYQVGAGLFSANAVPPYKSWEEFSKIIRHGVDALLATRPDTEKLSPFVAANLRYIDAFGPALTGGRSVSSFVRDILGITVGLPAGLTKHLTSDAEIRPYVQIQIPMNKGMIMTFSFGEGFSNNGPAILMDTAISTTVPVVATSDAVMDVFNEAHDAIHSTFMDLIAPILHLMPRKGEAET